MAAMYFFNNMIYLPEVSIMICLLLYAQGFIIVLKIDYVWALDLHLLKHSQHITCRTVQ